MNTGSNSVESKEKTNNSSKENKYNEKVAPCLKSLSAPKKFFITKGNISTPKRNNIESKIHFITAVDFNKDKKEKEHSKNNPLLIPKIEDRKLNIFNNNLIFNYS